MYTLLLIVFSLIFEPPFLAVEITGIKEVKGSVMIAIYDSKEQFLSTEVVNTKILKVAGSSVRGKIELPFGVYGISVFHDVNSDGELNTKIFGIPKEPVGFSNNAKGSFGPPSYEDVSFTFAKDQQLISIELF